MTKKFSFIFFTSFIFLLFAFGLSSCSFNPSVQGKGEVYLQGEWKQDSLPGQKQLLTYSLSDFKFTCDSFYIKVNTVSRVNYGADSCMNRGRWTEYIRGTYRQVKDTLQLRGFFYNADGTLKRENTCFRSGVFEEQYTVKKQADSILNLSTSSSVLPLTLRLTHRISCVPKPL
ncbi:fumarate hydratase [Mucilaginibacter limnophilus]|uniref:Fumarate hydratase n=1 Tax=Mucilaginibacter limnophilus TaxID=1932778 RepID=A0A437MUL6_9SPHI|nr:fumarate hydratase [Mucilaginibacter limnophilus]RVU01369.1 fumarate hydratase [Mucilaginibacter limnophilus]